MPTSPHIFPMKILYAFAFAMLLNMTAQANEPLVVGVKTSSHSANIYSFHVTVQHDDEGWDHYADNFEILTPDGKILATRVLAHPHVNEQPFTRSQSRVKIPSHIKEVDVRAHDSVHGYGPKVRYKLP